MRVFLDFVSPKEGGLRAVWLILQSMGARYNGPRGAFVSVELETEIAQNHLFAKLSDRKVSVRILGRAWAAGRDEQAVLAEAVPTDIANTERLAVDCDKCHASHVTAWCPNCTMCGKTGHAYRDCTQRAPFFCSNCAMEGHYAYECKISHDAYTYGPRPISAQVTCAACGEQGHISSAILCKAWGSCKTCSKCFAMGHLTDDCQAYLDRAT